MRAEASGRRGARVSQRPDQRLEDAQRLRLLAAQVGPHRLIFDLRTILAIEGRGDRIEHEAIVGPVDLRTWLGVAPAPHDDAVLVPGFDAVYRLLVCSVDELVQSDLRGVHRVPRVLEPLTTRLCIRGTVELADGGVGFLVDPARLGRVAWTARQAASPQQDAAP